MARSTALLLTCEHGGNRVPAAYVRLFKAHRERLESHRGYDPGALPLARYLARRFKAPLHYATVTRLLVELNRSIGHPDLFSDVSGSLSKEDRQRIVDRFYRPYRQAVEERITDLLRRHGLVLHLSVHTFTPVLHGVVRKTDFGLLYDPKRKGERHFCDRWREALRDFAPEFTVHRNQPYLGTADGFTTHLRKVHSPGRYLGIELEVNQRLAAGPPKTQANIHRLIYESLARAHASKSAIAE